MNIYQLVRTILDKLNYRIVSKKEYGRLGSMVHRYGEDAIIKAVDEISTWSFRPTALLDTLEKQCQKFTKKERNKISDEIEELL